MRDCDIINTLAVLRDSPPTPLISHSAELRREGKSTSCYLSLSLSAVVVVLLLLDDQHMSTSTGCDVASAKQRMSIARYCLCMSR